MLAEITAGTATAPVLGSTILLGPDACLKFAPVTVYSFVIAVLSMIAISVFSASRTEFSLALVPEFRYTMRALEDS